MATAYSVTLSTFFITSVATFVGSVRLQGLRPLVEYALFPMTCLFLLIVFTALIYASATILSTSGKFCRELTGLTDLRSRAKWYKAFQREVCSLRPFGVRTGPLKEVTKPSVMTVFGVWINYAASLLIALPPDYIHSF